MGWEPHGQESSARFPCVYEPYKNNKYDFTYLFAWNHKKEIFQKEKEYIKRGGKWLSHVKI